MTVMDRVKEETRVSVEAQGQIRFSVWVSFTEVYNEHVFDLLTPLPSGKVTKRNVLKLAEDKNGNIYCKGKMKVSGLFTFLITYLKTLYRV